jgi:hypothetical protein
VPGCQSIFQSSRVVTKSETRRKFSSCLFSIRTLR